MSAFTGAPAHTLAAATSESPEPKRTPSLDPTRDL
jgi:hypothetical protein